jgi:chorismate mutase / prephenate dehydratase
MGPVDMEAARQRITAIDQTLLDLVAERVRLAHEIGRAKEAAGAAPLDPSREAVVVRRAVEGARARGLPEEPVRSMVWTLIGLCRHAQIEARQ